MSISCFLFCFVLKRYHLLASKKLAHYVIATISVQGRTVQTWSRLCLDLYFPSLNYQAFETILILIYNLISINYQNALSSINGIYWYFDINRYFSMGVLFFVRLRIKIEKKGWSIKESLHRARKLSLLPYYLLSYQLLSHKLFIFGCHSFMIVSNILEWMIMFHCSHK